MDEWTTKKIEYLEDEAAVCAAANSTVTVELSRPLARLVRDMIGLYHLADKTRRFAGVGHSFQDDMKRLNAALGGDRTRDMPLSRWSARAAARVLHVTEREV